MRRGSTAHKLRYVTFGIVAPVFGSETGLVQPSFHCPVPTGSRRATRLDPLFAASPSVHAAHPRHIAAQAPPLASDSRDLVSGAAGNRTRVREASGLPSFTCVVALTQATGFADSAAT